MNISEFKAMLRNGEVGFEYKKVNGEIRPARGTLCETLMPKSEATRKFKLTNIEWVKHDLFPDGDKLPKSMTIKISDSFIADHSSNVKMFDIIVNALFEQFNKLVDGFKFEEVKPKKMAENMVFYYDLDKNGYRSFNFDTQFVGLA